uniref:Uncharacterized protein n=1 Tax=Chromera velia CCMP2878 TaxID=1169474 RepID=A0A0G4HLA7_9ALVE|eukprot:Cvel_28721.t1-p1 / transcript=Cvel_28721.t1 / gene=Cvel_28721 / organism=Chromera_velia_CCMP2878 / gene_product=hypothetical protein / transcript_product=hypothetical protein / location=Cvel_scaffold3812:1930-2766(-) / protein_length=279 / sequence_SO=supercontig / SO=protein_coding / is_pseudo=false
MVEVSEASFDFQVGREEKEDVKEWYDKDFAWRVRTENNIYRHGMSSAPLFSTGPFETGGGIVVPGLIPKGAQQAMTILTAEMPKFFRNWKSFFEFMSFATYLSGQMRKYNVCIDCWGSESPTRVSLVALPYQRGGKKYSEGLEVLQMMGASEDWCSEKTGWQWSGKCRPNSGDEQGGSNPVCGFRACVRSEDKRFEKEAQEWVSRFERFVFPPEGGAEDNIEVPEEEDLILKRHAGASQGICWLAQEMDGRMNPLPVLILKETSFQGWHLGLLTGVVYT